MGCAMKDMIEKAVDNLMTNDKNVLIRMKRLPTPDKQVNV